jgi:hypothetical protein
VRFAAANEPHGARTDALMKLAAAIGTKPQTRAGIR